jgi:hypothetical protein
MKSRAICADNLKDSDIFPKRLDCGIAMLHIELRTMAAGEKGRWEMLRTPDVGRFELI